MKRETIALALALFVSAPSAGAREIHLDCARHDGTVAVDVDTDRLFVQLMWGQGVAEEYRNGESYVSGPGSPGQQKVTYAVSVDKDSVIFGQDRICAGAGGKCRDAHLRNTLDAAAGVLRYDDSGIVEISKCAPAPPGRRF